MPTKASEVREAFKMSFLCLSGIDDTIPPRTICDISQEFGFIEWGINFRQEKQGKEPRYASLAWLRQLREEIENRQQTGKFAPIHFSAHLGGEYCIDVMKGDASLVRTLWEEYGFLRIRLSPTRARGVNSNHLKQYLPTLKYVIQALQQIEFVLEVSKETKALSFALMDEPQPNLSFLYVYEDGSKGEPLRAKPLPHPGIHVGYSGCLDADNLKKELLKIGASVNSLTRPVWIDLEGGIRSGKSDDFDLRKVWACLCVLADMGLPRKPLA